MKRRAFLSLLGIAAAPKPTPSPKPQTQSPPIYFEDVEIAHVIVQDYYGSKFHGSFLFPRHYGLGDAEKFILGVIGPADVTRNVGIHNETEALRRFRQETA